MIKIIQKARKCHECQFCVSDNDTKAETEMKWNECFSCKNGSHFIKRKRGNKK